MNAILTFFIAFFFSFVGTIPPGTLNLSIIQLGLEHRLAAAWRFALASAIIEYFYAWIAVKFEDMIAKSVSITEHFQLITAIVMIFLGVFSFWSAKKPTPFSKKFSESGFRRGILLGLLNPLALPFWIAMTAYIKSQRWANLSDDLELHAYLLGVALGGLSLMMLAAYLAKNVVTKYQTSLLLKKIPAFILLVLGIYALAEYLL
jgi:threonine/homoserine/homoserine lactone efflux protein